MGGGGGLGETGGEGGGEFDHLEFFHPGVRLTTFFWRLFFGGCGLTSVLFHDVMSATSLLKSLHAIGLKLIIDFFLRKRAKNQQLSRPSPECPGSIVARGGLSSQFKNNYFTEMCSGSEAGSYLRLIEFCITQQ